MKILLGYLNRIDRFGGIGRVIWNMSNTLTERGHQVSIVYSGGKPKIPGLSLDPSIRLYDIQSTVDEESVNSVRNAFPLYGKIIRELVRPFNIRAAHGIKEYYVGNSIKPRLLEIIREIEPDIILSNWPQDTYYWTNAIDKNIPIITMLHATPTFLFEKESDLVRRACERSAKVQVLLKGDLIRAKEFIPNANLVWIPNAIPQYEKAVKLDAPKTKYVITHVGRIDKNDKRQHLLIEAFVKLAPDFPQWNLEFWGDERYPEKGYLQELNSLVEKNHLTGRVVFKGTTENVQEKLLRSDIFAFPSLHEGFGLALGEAMSAGLPVVACKQCDASRELVTQKSGILVEDNAESFTEGLRSLMVDPQLRIAMGSAAKKAITVYSPEHVADRWEAVLLDSLHQHTH